jgi:hypothetical protein
MVSNRRPAIYYDIAIDHTNLSTYHELIIFKTISRCRKTDSTVTSYSFGDCVITIYIIRHVIKIIINIEQTDREIHLIAVEISLEFQGLIQESLPCATPTKKGENQRNISVLVSAFGCT